MTARLVQSGILAPVPLAARHLFFRQMPGSDVDAALRALAASVDGDRVVAGLGLSLVQALGAAVPGLRAFPQLATGGLDIPSTPCALWLWLRGEDRGDLLHLGRRLEALLAPALTLEKAVDAFRYDSGRDLTGYEDGTENPQDDAALQAAAVGGQGAGLDGSSFAAVQQWLHDFPRFDALGGVAQDHAIGRRRSDNAELDDAPPSAHVKRTAQESFDPEAFVVRRSLPWSDSREAGLMFLAFGRTLDAFEAQLRRMAGVEDGITDALFNFTRPLSGSYFWCPPLIDGHLDLQQLGL
ncbi:MAG: Dyp-type peroxidase [Rhodocyclaceae bacterium]|nr:Dyp-type peroxidase [Rhodocyclaceae bacterium]